MTSSLTQCGVCTQSFTKDDFPLFPNNPLVFTVCINKIKKIDRFFFHIFHTKCLSKWVKLQNPCPVCKQEIDKNQLGKGYDNLVTVFLTALQHNPIIVRSVMKTPVNTNQECTCKNDLPVFPLLYDHQKTLFVHLKCSSSKKPNVFMGDLANIVKEIIEQDPKLQENFTPIRPNFLERICIDHPLAVKVAVIESIALSALLLNKYSFGGNSWLLFTIGLPAYLTLIVAQQVGLLIIALLNKKI